jgi:dTDP-D-glucose 4,6-dehydratase
MHFVRGDVADADAVSKALADHRIDTIVLFAAESPLPVCGDGRSVRDWLFVDDLSNAIDRIIHAGVSGARSMSASDSRSVRRLATQLRGARDSREDCPGNDRRTRSALRSSQGGLGSSRGRR